MAQIISTYYLLRLYKKYIFEDQLIINNQKMQIYNGIEIDRNSKEWKDLLQFFPRSSWKGLASRIERRFEEICNKEGIELDQDFWLRPVKEIIEAEGWTVGAVCLKIFSRWTRDLELAFSGLYFRGTGNCSNCGSSIEELFDFGNNGEALGKCKNCGGVQGLEMQKEDYYNPRN
jgi:hypothetical protein